MGNTWEEGSGIADGGAPLPTRVFNALAHQRRRYILYYTRDRESVNTDELAVQITAWEQDCPRHDVSAADVNRVKTTLIQNHLPKLDDYGLVEYDQRSATVSYSYPPGLLDDAIELTATMENPP